MLPTPGFVAASLLLLLTPGPTNTLIAAAGAALGIRRAALAPLAEAAGYLIAVSAHASLAALAGGGALLPALKLVAAAWIAVTAVGLWRRGPARTETPAAAARRVFTATLLNPKAMIVGTLMIPPQPAGDTALWVAVYAALAVVAGVGWLWFGAALPGAARRHAYRGAAAVLAGFSLAAVASVFA